MIIQAIQKLTLLDFPGHTAATVFTGGCNLRCPFCHNSSLVTDKCEGLVSEEELYALLEKRRGLLDGVAITGGEPLLHADIGNMLAKIKEMGYGVKLDTNGSKPDRLEELLKAGLVDYVAMDVKNSKENYSKAVGIENIHLEPFERSIEIIKNSGIDHEFRTTLVKGIHEKEDIEAICRWIGPESKYFLQMFVDSGDVLENRKGDFGGKMQLTAFPKEEAEAILAAARAIKPNTEIRGM